MGATSILVVNPGSTSTKVGHHACNEWRWQQVVEHPLPELAALETRGQQLQYRKRVLQLLLSQQQLDLSQLTCIVARGGLLRPTKSGVYVVDELMVSDLTEGYAGDHPANLGGLLALGLAGPLGIPAYVVDPPSVDEFWPVSRLSGLPEIPRRSLLHALSLRAAARRACEDNGWNYPTVNLVVVHLGGGISVSAHYQGRIVDVNNANEQGPFSPQRCGGLPARSLVRWCFSGAQTEKQILDRMLRRGGMYAYLGTGDGREIAGRMSAGDDEARLVVEAMAYQVAKEIGGMAAALGGDIQAIVITGRLAQLEPLSEGIRSRTEFIAPVTFYPTDLEMDALVQGALRVVNGLEEPRQYAVEVEGL